MKTVRRRTPIKIMRLIGNKDPVTNEIVSDTEVVRCGVANISPIRGKEFYDNANEGVNITHRISIRYVRGIRESMIVQTSSCGQITEYDINAVLNPEMRNRELILLATERRG